MVKVNVYKNDGSTKGEVELPAVFSSEFRPDLIRKTVNAFQANRRQPYGSNPMAGKSHSEYSVRSGQGISRVPRMAQGSTAVLSPHVVGGRRAHPPKVEKIWSEKINKKEKAKAFASALGACADAEMVAERGHVFRDGLTMPVVIDDSVGSIMRTADVVKALGAIGVGGDLVRADEGKHQRPGKGKLRGRRYKTPKSILIVVDDDAAIAKSASNLTGVDITTVSQLNTEKLAPGGDPGRLTVFTESALAKLEGSS